MHCHPCVSEGYRMSRTDTPPDAAASRVIAPTSSYCCPGPKPAALWPMRQGWSSTRGLVPRAGESGRLLHRGGMDTQTGFGARTWALRLSCGVVVEAAEKALCDRLSGLVRMVRSPCLYPHPRRPGVCAAGDHIERGGLWRDRAVQDVSAPGVFPGLRGVT